MLFVPSIDLTRKVYTPNAIKILYKSASVKRNQTHMVKIERTNGVYTVVLLQF